MQLINFPPELSCEDYQNANSDILTILTKYFPHSTIYTLGGAWLNPGISDLDYLIVSSGRINGNLLHRSNYPKKYIENGIMYHSPFAISSQTFKWIRRLTSYNFKCASGHPLNILPSNKESNILKLALYIVINYPMRFAEEGKVGAVNVRRIITKYKKIFQIEALFKEAFNGDVSLLSSPARDTITYLCDNIQRLDRTQIEESVIYLLSQEAEISRKILEEFELRFNGIGATGSKSYLEFSGKKMVFTEGWRKRSSRGFAFYPPGLAIVLGLFKEIPSKYLVNIKWEADSSLGRVGQEYGEQISGYLNYCDENHIEQLIFDIPFSVKGYTSFKVKIWRKFLKYIYPK